MLAKLERHLWYWEGQMLIAMDLDDLAYEMYAYRICRSIERKINKLKGKA